MVRTYERNNLTLEVETGKWSGLMITDADGNKRRIAISTDKEQGDFCKALNNFLKEAL